MTRVRSTWLRSVSVLFASLLSIALTATVAEAKPGAEIKVMTRNLYLGADLNPVIASQTLPELFVAASNAYANVLATNFNVRAQAIAAEIASNDPDFVGLQEAVVWSAGPSPSSMTVTFDFEQLLLSALTSLGRHYHRVVAQTGFQGMAPSAFGWIGLTDRDILIARDDLAARGISVSNTQGSHYATNVAFTSPILGPVTIWRQWISADVTAGDKTFRLISTHLETEDFPPVQAAQAAELLAGPAKASLPVLLVCDCNSPAPGSIDATFTATYPMLVAAGFKDTWLEANPSDLGWSCCQAGDLVNATSLLHERIDLVMHKRSWKADTATLVGAGGRVGGLWPSDHAGVAAALEVLGA